MAEDHGPTIERTTFQSYKGLIDARLDTFFRERGLRLEELEPKHIRELHQTIFKDGCNANTVIHYHAVVRKALQYAVKNGLVNENVADRVDRPKRENIWRRSTPRRSWLTCLRPPRMTPSLW